MFGSPYAHKEAVFIIEEISCYLRNPLQDVEWIVALVNFTNVR